MIERLNFYDVYGYLIPGLALLGALWVPFQLVTVFPPPAQWATAFVAVVLGYVAGHLLQTLADKAFPHARKVSGGGRRPFSSLMLDENEETFSEDLRTAVKRRIRRDFSLDVDGGDPNTLEGRRRDAFMLCRAALVRNEAAAYAEQSQGMYALMQGLAAAATVAIFYLAGWLAAACVRPEPKVLRVLVVLAVVALVVTAALPKTGRYALWLTAIASGFVGFLCGDVWPFGVRAFYLLLGGCVMAFFVAFKCHAAYLDFAKNFAATIYRDFLYL